MSEDRVIFRYIFHCTWYRNVHIGVDNSQSFDKHSFSIAVAFTKMNNISFTLSGKQLFFRWRQDLFTYNSNINLIRHKVLRKFTGRRIKLKDGWSIG